MAVPEGYTHIGSKLIPTALAQQNLAQTISPKVVGTGSGAAGPMQTPAPIPIATPIPSSGGSHITIGSVPGDNLTTTWVKDSSGNYRGITPTAPTTDITPTVAKAQTTSSQIKPMTPIPDAVTTSPTVFVGNPSMLPKGDVVIGGTNIMIPLSDIELANKNKIAIKSFHASYSDAERIYNELASRSNLTGEEKAKLNTAKQILNTTNELYDKSYLKTQASKDIKDNVLDPFSSTAKNLTQTGSDFYKLNPGQMNVIAEVNASLTSGNATEAKNIVEKSNVFADTTYISDAGNRLSQDMFNALPKQEQSKYTAIPGQKEGLITQLNQAKQTEETISQLNTSLKNKDIGHFYLDVLKAEGTGKITPEQSLDIQRQVYSQNLASKVNTDKAQPYLSTPNVKDIYLGYDPNAKIVKPSQIVFSDISRELDIKNIEMKNKGTNLLIEWSYGSAQKLYELTGGKGQSPETKWYEQYKSGNYSDIEYGANNLRRVAALTNFPSDLIVAFDKAGIGYYYAIGKASDSVSNLNTDIQLNRIRLERGTDVIIGPGRYIEGKFKYTLNIPKPVIDLRPKTKEAISETLSGLSEPAAFMGTAYVAGKIPLIIPGMLTANFVERLQDVKEGKVNPETPGLELLGGATTFVVLDKATDSGFKAFKDAKTGTGEILGNIFTRTKTLSKSEAEALFKTNPAKFEEAYKETIEKIEAREAAAKQSKLNDLKSANSFSTGIKDIEVSIGKASYSGNTIFSNEYSSIPYRIKLSPNIEPTGTLRVQYDVLGNRRVFEIGDMMPELQPELPSEIPKSENSIAIESSNIKPQTTAGSQVATRQVQSLTLREPIKARLLNGFRPESLYYTQPTTKGMTTKLNISQSQTFEPNRTFDFTIKEPAQKNRLKVDPLQRIEEGISQERAMNLESAVDFRTMSRVGAESRQASDLRQATELRQALGIRTALNLRQGTQLRQGFELRVPTILRPPILNSRNKTKQATVFNVIGTDKKAKEDKPKSKKAYRSQFSDLMSIAYSEMKYGKATSPSLVKNPNLWKGESIKIPTLEMLGKGSNKNTKGKGLWW